MQHAFNIYPALLILTPVVSEETISIETQNDWVSETERYFPNCTQTYWGNCLVNDTQKQFMFRFTKDEQACPVQELLHGRLNVLEPTKFKGKHYTITYIPVLN